MAAGPGLFGMLVLLGIVGFIAYLVMRAVKRRGQGSEEGDESSGRGYVYKVQIALGRSARGIQARLAQFAEEGDTRSEEGLAALLQQTSLEILRERNSICYAAATGEGPLDLALAESKMNGITLGERSRFQVERVRGADGTVRHSDVAAEESKEVLEYVLVTLVVATRTPISAASAKNLSEPEATEALLSELGGVAPNQLLGLDVIWTPADSNDSLTEMDLLTTYPQLQNA
jgi:uncharacterized membrane protein